MRSGRVSPGWPAPQPGCHTRPKLPPPPLGPHMPASVTSQHIAAAARAPRLALVLRCGSQWAWPQFYHALLLSAHAMSDLLSPASWRTSQARQFNRQAACCCAHELQGPQARRLSCRRGRCCARLGCVVVGGAGRRLAVLLRPARHSCACQAAMLAMRAPAQCRHAASLDAGAGRERGLP